jgi:transcriptional regulator with XRE-family HTH domain
MNGEDFGKRIRELRERRGLTQARFGKRAGVAADTVSRVEGAHFSPTLDTMIKLAEALDLPLEGLLRDNFDESDELATLIRALPDRDRKIAGALVGAMHFWMLDDQ